MINEPMCFARKCSYFLGVKQADGSEFTEKVFCQAFPDGIPGEIAYGSNLHNKKYIGQKGDFTYKREK